MGDTDVNVSTSTETAHTTGGKTVDRASLSIRFHLGNAGIDQTLVCSPPLARALTWAARAEGLDTWPGPRNRLEHADLEALNEVLLRHPSWFGLTQTLGLALRDSALRSLVTALRYPHG